MATREIPDDSITILMSDKAAEVIRNQFDQLGKIADVFGFGSPEYEKAATSHRHCLSGVLTRTAFGRETSIMPEPGLGRGDKLSLYIVNTDLRAAQPGGKPLYFEFGMIWFRDRRYDGTDKEGLAGEWSLHS